MHLIRQTCSQRFKLCPRLLFRLLLFPGRPKIKVRRIFCVRSFPSVRLTNLTARGECAMMATKFNILPAFSHNFQFNRGVCPLRLNFTTKSERLATAAKISTLHCGKIGRCSSRVCYSTDLTKDICAKNNSD